MNKSSIAGLALFAALTLPLVASAQVPVPTPPPNPLEYDDSAMHYTAPANAVLLRPIQHPALATLSDDPTTVAEWGIGKTQYDAKIIALQLESYTNDLDGFDSTYENALRQDDPSTFVKNKELVKLANGMPAYFLEITQGAGFNARKIFAYIWIDSQRGVVLSVMSELGVVNEQSAKQLLGGATGVRYPSDQP